MTKISSSQFRDQMKTGVDTKDAATQQRLNAAGVDGKKVLADADLNKDGKVQGDNEADALFKKIDSFDVDGSRSTVSGAKSLGLISAMRAPAGSPPPPAAGSVGAAAGAAANLYGPDSSPGTLAKGAKGPEVKTAQEKLLKLNYEMPKFGADGSFGNETQTAVKQFQGDNKLPQTGELDPTTLSKLDTAGPKKAGNVQFPEYDKMYADGVLQTTVGIGFDEDGNDIDLRRQAIEGLAERGFSKLDVKNLSDDQLKKKGFDPSTIDRSANYFSKSFDHEGKPVQALVKLVDRNSPDAKGQFAKGMGQDDLVIYGGHARRGSGPDFDHANSSAGNYVIGKPTEAGHYKLGANDLKKPGALSNNYQLMFFDACSSKNYLDDLRSVPKNKNAGNLDVVASTRELPWSTGKQDMFAMLDGVMGGKSINHIKGQLDGINAEQGKGAAFIADGFKGNSYQPSR